MAANRKSKRKAPPEIIGPTPERLRHGNAVVVDIVDKGPNGIANKIGKANRFVPMIDTLRPMFSEREWKALHFYRHHAMVAESSPVRDSLCIQRHGGNGTGPTIEVLNAVRVVRDCEAAAGSLVDILRAVALEDTSLSEWAMRSGSVEQCRERKGKRVCTLEPKRKALEIAQLEIRMVAKRVEAELAA